MKPSTVIATLFLVTIFVGLILNVAPAKAESSDIVILSNSIYQTYGISPFNFNQGDYHVAGEVRNVGAQALHFNMTCTFYDSSNNKIGIAYLTDTSADFGPSYLHVLLPGKTSPFRISLSRFNPEGDFILVDHYAITINASITTLYKLGLEIMQHESQENAGTLMISGEIKNIGTDYIDGFNVYATFYDSQGDVLAVSSEGGGYTLIDSSGRSGFPPSNTTSFQVTLNDFPHGGRLQKIDRYELTAEGYDYSLWDAEGQLITPEVAYVLGSLPTNTPQPTQAQSPRPAQTQDSPFILYLVIAAIAITVVLSTIVLIKHKSK